MGIAEMPVVEIEMPVWEWFRFATITDHVEAFAEIMHPVMKGSETPEKDVAPGGPVWWARYIFTAALESVVVVQTFDMTRDTATVVLNVSSVSLLIFTAESVASCKEMYHQYGLFLHKRYREVLTKAKGTPPHIDETKDFLANTMLTMDHIKTLSALIKKAAPSAPLAECAKARSMTTFRRKENA